MQKYVLFQQNPKNSRLYHGPKKKTSTQEGKKFDPIFDPNPQVNGFDLPDPRVESGVSTQTLIFGHGFGLG